MLSSHTVQTDSELDSLLSNVSVFDCQNLDIFARGPNGVLRPFETMMVIHNFDYRIPQ